MIHLMHYVTRDSFEADRDDWRHMAPDSMAEHAWPVVAKATTEASPAWINACREAVENELREMDYAPEVLEDMAEQAECEEWRSKGEFVGNGWQYPTGGIYLLPSGEFAIVGHGEQKRYPNKTIAEDTLFYATRPPEEERVAPTPPTFSWTVEAKNEQKPNEVYYEHTCWLGGEVVAVMVIRELDDELV